MQFDGRSKRVLPSHGCSPRLPLITPKAPKPSGGIVDDRVPAAIDDPDLDAWARDYLERVERPVAMRASSSASASSSSAPPATTRTLTDADLDAAFEEARAFRARASALADTDPTDFVPLVRGSRWTAEHVGRAVDRVGARARGQHAIKWCEAYDLSKSFTCSTKEAEYSIEEINELSKEWCRKMQWLFDKFVESDDDLFVYTDVLINEYPERDDFSAWADALSPKKSAKGRVLELKKLKPTREPLGAKAAPSKPKRATLA